nr:immunoglobulin heavy chain junction region [Mus musculus]
ITVQGGTTVVPPTLT